VLEVPGDGDHPLIVWWLSLCGLGFDVHDEVAWCSAFVNGMAWDLRLPRSKSALARSWLAVGASVPLGEAQVGYDVVIIQRGTGSQPGPDVLNAPGHVGLFAGVEDKNILILGGNQGDAVSVARYPKSRLLGVRRLA
jgi:uncharacterized protein (TIGR02594 family)